MAIAQGDLSIEVQTVSDKDQLSKNFSTAIKNLKQLLDQTDILSKAAQNGELGSRAKADGLAGSYRELIIGFNSTLDSVLKPIDEAAMVLDQIAERDLSVRVLGTYQGDHARIKQSLNLAVGNLDEGLLQVANGAEQVGSAANQIGDGSQSLAQGSSEQANSLQGISSRLHEIASMASQNAANAKESQSIAEGARSSAELGVESMHRLSEAIDRIKTSSDETSKIVKTIDEIAFQTNLLALNAAVEAARAGEAGKGFAVVAEEVRNLAIRSAEAARNTSDLIDSAVQYASEGVLINDEVLKNLDEINTQIEKVSAGMAEITVASDQQSDGIDHLNTAVEQMNQVTQQTAASAEESASTAEELSSQAEQMNYLVGLFNLTDKNFQEKQKSLESKLPVNSKSIKNDFDLTGLRNSDSGDSNILIEF
jgi:methyl-accepting chemotaxis protein